MTKQGEYDDKLVRLRAVVSAYGGDPMRWPQSDQQALSPFVETEPEAQAIVSEGRSLDQLLDRADVALAGREPGGDDLADRIFASVVSSDNVAGETHETAGGNVVDLASHRKALTRPAVDDGRDDELVSRAGWMSAAALAASLVIGVFIGANGYVESATTGLSEIAGLVTPAETLQLEDGLGPVEEDYL